MNVCSDETVLSFYIAIVLNPLKKKTNKQTSEKLIKTDFNTGKQQWQRLVSVSGCSIEKINAWLAWANQDESIQWKNNNKKTEKEMIS